jgi:hypothetical protein
MLGTYYGSFRVGVRKAEKGEGRMDSASERECGESIKGKAG